MGKYSVDCSYLISKLVIIENWIHWKAFNIETMTKIKSISHLRWYTLVDSICWSGAVLFDSASGTQIYKTAISSPFFCACFCVSRSWSLTVLFVIFASMSDDKCQCSPSFQDSCTLQEWEQISSPFIDRPSWLGPVRVTAQAKKGAILEINFSKMITVVLSYLHLRSTLQTWLRTSEIIFTVVRDYPYGWLLMLCSWDAILISPITSGSRVNKYSSRLSCQSI